MSFDTLPEHWLVSWGVTGAALETVRTYAEEIHFPARATIFAAGDPGDGMYLVMVGMVLVLGRDRRGQERTVSIVTEGQCFGELALLLERPRQATVAAGLDTTLLKITPEAMTRLEADHPALAVKLYKSLAQTLAEQWFQRVKTSSQ